MKKSNIVIILFIIFICTICALVCCNNYRIEVMQEKIIYNDSNITIEYDKVFDYLISNKKTYMDSFMKEFNIKYYKSIMERKYIVANSSDGVIIVWFNNHNECCDLVQGSISNKTSDEFISNIKIGDSLWDVYDRDPLGNYDFMYAGWSEYPEISYHFFVDGISYEIRYEDSLVKEIIKFTI